MQKEYFITNSSSRCTIYSKLDNLNKCINSLLKKKQNNIIFMRFNKNLNCGLFYF